MEESTLEIHDSGGEKQYVRTRYSHASHCLSSFTVAVVSLRLTSSFAHAARHLSGYQLFSMR